MAVQRWDCVLQKRGCEMKGGSEELWWKVVFDVQKALNGAKERNDDLIRDFEKREIVDGRRKGCWSCREGVIVRRNWEEKHW